MPASKLATLTAVVTKAAAKAVAKLERVTKLKSLRAKFKSDDDVHIAVDTVIRDGK